MTSWTTLPTARSQAGRLVGYARVSTDDQRLDIQLAALEQAGCAQVFTDHGVSGAKASRPGLDAMLSFVRSGDTLVVYKLDRLGRSSFHLADLLTKLAEMEVQFWSLTEGINTGHFGGKMVYHIFAAIAEFHRDLIRENTVNGMRAARDRGAAIGRPRKLTRQEVAAVHVLLLRKEVTIANAALNLGVSESTLVRALRRHRSAELA